MLPSVQLKPVNDNAAWVGTDMLSRSDWKYILTARDIDDLRHMVAQVRPQLNGDANKLLSLQKEHFNLGHFGLQLQQVYTNLQEGSGLAMIKGLPIHELDHLDLAIMYWAIGLQFGRATPNNPDGDMLGHVTDLGKTQKDANTRGYQTREAMDYHCDQCDIVGLLCVRPAVSGGVSKVASSIAIYNELVQSHPEHAHALTESLYWSKMGEYADGEQPFYKSPVFNFINEKLCVAFGAKHIEKGYDLPETPSMSAMLRDALKLTEDIAERQRLDIVLEPGDMQFLNNYVVVHTRTAYVDAEHADSKRLLWRLWLMNSELRPRTAYAQNFQNGVKLGLGNNQIRL